MDPAEKSSGNVKLGEAVVVDGRIYYTNWDEGQTLYSVKTDGSDIKKLSHEDAWRINVTGGRIYYASHESGKRGIYSMKTDGSDQKLLTNQRASDIHVLGDRIFYLDFTIPISILSKPTAAVRINCTSTI